MSPADVAFQRGHQDAFEQLVLHRVGELGNLQVPAKKRRGASKGCREYLLQPLRYEEGRLLDDRRKAVMMAWEAQLMARHAEVLLPQKGLKVLNVGFGMGLVDGFLQEKEPSLHVIVEAHKDVLAEMRRRGWHARPGVKVYEGVWQDILSQLPGGFDAVFFDTWAEGYEELSCFQAALPRLLGPEGRFSFFNGLAPWSVAEHAAWCRLAQERPPGAGLLLRLPAPGEIRQGDWQGVCERYWQTFDTYYLPLARRDPTWEASWRGWPTFPVHVSDQMGVKLPLREFGLCTGDLGGDNCFPRHRRLSFAWLCYDDPKCIGAFAFVWGWKWEKTGTWYGLFNEWTAVTENITLNCTICESEADPGGVSFRRDPATGRPKVLGALQKCWTGQDKETKAPSLHSISMAGEPLQGQHFSVDQTAVTLAVNASTTQGTALSAVWVVTEEVVSMAVGGAYEATNPLLPDLFENGPDNTSGMGLSVQLNTTSLKMGGEYRLYVFVREDPAACGARCNNHEAYASVAFKICHDAVPGEQCYSQVKYAMDHDLAANPGRYPGADTTSSFSEVQMVLAQLQLSGCQFPCDVSRWCHTTQPGEACYEYMEWLLEGNNTQDAPQALRWAKSLSRLNTQRAIHENLPGICPRPCLVDVQQCFPNCVDEGEGGGGTSELSKAASATALGLLAGLTWLV
ncbi:unnamed protein product [Effrenium voratum]|nr:unnamed protein product [Effrenium voratum]